MATYIMATWTSRPASIVQEPIIPHWAQRRLQISALAQPIWLWGRAQGAHIPVVKAAICCSDREVFLEIMQLHASVMFIEGISGANPSGTTATVVVDSSGQLGTMTGTAITSSERTDTLPTFSPAGFNLTIRSYKMVTITISAAILTLEALETMITLPALQPEYYPAATVAYSFQMVSYSLTPARMPRSLILSSYHHIIVVVFARLSIFPARCWRRAWRMSEFPSQSFQSFSILFNSCCGCRGQK